MSRRWEIKGWYDARDQLAAMKSEEEKEKEMGEK
jgi:hypothetical protein